MNSLIENYWIQKLSSTSGQNCIIMKVRILCFFELPIDNQKELDSESEYSDQQYDRNTEYIRTDREGNIGNF